MTAFSTRLVRDARRVMRGDLTERQQRQLDAMLLAAGEPLSDDGTVNRAHAVAERVKGRLLVQRGA